MSDIPRIVVGVDMNVTSTEAIHGNPVNIGSGTLVKLLCDLVEEATQRGMEVGAKMMLESMQDDLSHDEDTPREFPGFLDGGN